MRTNAESQGLGNCGHLKLDLACVGREGAYFICLDCGQKVEAGKLTQEQLLELAESGEKDDYVFSIPESERGKMLSFPSELGLLAEKLRKEEGRGLRLRDLENVKDLGGRVSFEIPMGAEYLGVMAYYYDEIEGYHAPAIWLRFYGRDKKCLSHSKIPRNHVQLEILAERLERIFIRVKNFG
jgi:hypothetical protein